MSNYKVNINKQKPSDQEIDQYKDFDNMVNTYGKIHRPWYALKSLYKDRKLIRLFVIIIAVILAIYISHRALKHNKTPNEQGKSRKSESSNHFVKVSPLAFASAN